MNQSDVIVEEKLFANRIREYSQDRVRGLYFEFNGKTYCLEVRYELGGMNYFTSRVDQRGVFLSIKPIEITFDEKGNVKYTSFMLFSGIKLLLEPQPRYSKQKLERIAWHMLHNPDQHAKAVELMKAVLEKESRNG